MRTTKVLTNYETIKTPGPPIYFLNFWRNWRRSGVVRTRSISTTWSISISNPRKSCFPSLRGCAWRLGCRLHLRHDGFYTVRIQAHTCASELESASACRPMPMLKTSPFDWLNYDVSVESNPYLTHPQYIIHQPKFV